LAINKSHYDSAKLISSEFHS